MKLHYELRDPESDREDDHEDDLENDHWRDLLSDSDEDCFSICRGYLMIGMSHNLSSVACFLALENPRGQCHLSGIG